MKHIVILYVFVGLLYVTIPLGLLIGTVMFKEFTTAYTTKLVERLDQRYVLKTQP